MNLHNIFKKKIQPTTSQQVLGTIKENGITFDQLRELYIELENAGAFLDQQSVQGDGKATFIEAMTDEEYVKWEHENEHGWKKVYDKFLKRN